MEMMQRGNPLFDLVFMRDDGTATGTPLEKRVDSCGQRHTATLSRAAAIVRDTLGGFYPLMTQTVRQVFVFSEPGVLSFARMTAHGAVFLNEAQGVCEEPFFIYELVCRCAITLFSSMSPRPRDFFSVDPNQRLDHFQILRGGDRNLYTALHGMFYECLMTLCMDALHRDRVLAGRQGHEVLGRLSYLHGRFRADIHDLMLRGDVLSDLGREFYRLLTRPIDVLIGRREACERLDLGNQLGLFDYDRFAALNPCPST
jgi:hypothetical protein